MMFYKSAALCVQQQRRANESKPIESGTAGEEIDPESYVMSECSRFHDVHD